MDDVAMLSSCTQLTAEHAVAAARTLPALRRLVARVMEIARPEEGSPKLLMVLARVGEAPWLEGDLGIELSGDDNTTTIALYADHGFGIRERVIPNIRLRVPFEEFERALMIAPKLIHPMQAKERNGKLLLGKAIRDGREDDDVGLAAIAIDDRSLHETERKTAPPKASGSAAEKVEVARTLSSGPPAAPDKSGVHTHPTVRRMVAIRPEAKRSSNDDD
jgi:hypothetical protein